MIAAFLVALAAFLLFATAMDRRARRAPLLRTTAWTSVALDFALCLHAQGAVFGPIAWVGTLMAAAAAVFCLVNFALRRPIR